MNGRRLLRRTSEVRMSEREIRLLRDAKDCRTCEGTGIVVEDDTLVPCPDCDGIHERVAEWNVGDFSMGRPEWE